MAFPVSRSLARVLAPAALLAYAPALAQEAEPPLDPQAPLADLPDLGVAWPELDDPGELPPADPAAAPVETVGEQRYRISLIGLGEAETPLLRQRFDALSALEKGEGDPANVAQIDRRAREDEELLTELLRAEGYYDALVEARVEPAAASGERLTVVLAAEPGPLYRLGSVELRGLEAAGTKSDELAEAFAVKPGDPVDADKVLAGEAALRAEAGQEGFPFARIGEPEVVIDHDARTATLTLDVEPGGLRRFGRVTVDDDGLLGAKHVQTIARFDPGDEFDQLMVDDLRRALIATGLVSQARVEPVPGASPDTVDIAVALEPAPPRTIAGELGYGTGEGARAEVSWQHRNFFRPEGAVTFRGVLGTQEQLASATLRRNNFGGRDRVVNAQIQAANIDRDAFAARTFSIAGSYERQTNIIFQKKWTWSVGAELLASDERDFAGPNATERRRTFFIAAFPGQIGYDGSDDLLDPTRGFRLSGRVSPEVSLQSGTFGYARVQLDASGYLPFGRTVVSGPAGEEVPRVVLAGRLRAGSILGAARDRIAPSRRFYAGGGGSVRGYGFQAIGPRDINNDPEGGKSLLEVSAEARIRLSAFGGAFGLVPFVDAGNISSGGLPDFSDLRIGAGLGIRYHTNFGPIRVDVGTPINPQRGDPRVAVYVSLGQAF